jgi:hypothetical protein
MSTISPQRVTERLKKKRRKDAVRAAVALTLVATQMLHMRLLAAARNRTYLVRPGIVSPSLSPWRYLVTSGSDLSLICTIGLDALGLRRLHVDVYGVEADPGEFPNIRPAATGGRPRLLSTLDKVGVGLLWLRSSDTNMNLCLLFGITPADCSRALNEIIARFSRFLRTAELSVVNYPNPSQCLRFSQLVEAYEPGVRGS